MCSFPACSDAPRYLTDGGDRASPLCVNNGETAICLLRAPVSKLLTHSGADSEFDQFGDAVVGNVCQRQFI